VGGGCTLVRGQETSCCLCAKRFEPATESEGGRIQAHSSSAVPIGGIVNNPRAPMSFGRRVTSNYIYHEVTYCTSIVHHHIYDACKSCRSSSLILGGLVMAAVSSDVPDNVDLRWRRVEADLASAVRRSMSATS
jgi:hypothetical protein